MISTVVAFHLLSYTALFFVIGIIKPKWTLFFMKEPTRFLISSISLVGFMIGMTIYGQAHKEEIVESKKEAEKTEIISEVPKAKEEVKEIK
jgi:VIT1/CCC1 family predicted Fe2+/Mn2+ transporter